MKIKQVTAQDTFVVRLDFDEDILITLRKAIKELGIENGIIVCGAGSVKDYKYHDVKFREIPTYQAYAEASEPADIISITGFIIDGRIHAHISMGKPGQAFGGHLEEGCIILSFGAVMITKIDESLDGLDFPGTLESF